MTLVSLPHASLVETLRERASQFPDSCRYLTSSGKIQRRACRWGFLAGSSAELARWEMGHGSR